MPGPKIEGLQGGWTTTPDKAQKFIPIRQFPGTNKERIINLPVTNNPADARPMGPAGEPKTQPTLVPVRQREKVVDIISR